MKLSARNQLVGKIVAINDGAVNSIVTLDVNGVPISATISCAAVEDLDLKVGQKAIAVIKSTEVMIGLGTMAISARNKLTGKITAVTEGAVNAIVTLDIGSNNISSVISLSAVQELGLKVGDTATAVIKATSVMIGVED